MGAFFLGAYHLRGGALRPSWCEIMAAAGAAPSRGYGRGLTAVALGFFLVAGHEFLRDVFAPIVTEKSLQPSVLGQVGGNLVEAALGQKMRQEYMEVRSKGGVHMSFCHA